LARESLVNSRFEICDAKIQPATSAKLDIVIVNQKEVRTTVVRPASSSASK
jgi:hypothetical protein